MSYPPLRTNYDVVIVGARVAGAATGMLLARAGLRVLVFDKSRYGSDTVSTHALMRPAVLLLKRWGLVDELRTAGTPAVRRTTFWYDDGERPDVRVIDIRSRHGVDALYSPRRTVLDRVLVDAARDAGAQVVHGLRLVDVLGKRDPRVRGVVVEDKEGGRHEIRAGLVIGADGRKSVVARQVGAAAYVTGRHASTTSYGYFRNLPVDGNRWYYGPGVGAGALPTNEGLTLVFGAIEQDDAGRSRNVLRRSFATTVAGCAPDIGAALSRAELIGKIWSFTGMTGFLRQSHGPGWALVGDAGYMSDPITAHGITNALRDAEILSRSIVEGACLSNYQIIRDDLSRVFFEISDRVASYDWDVPTVRNYHLLMSQEMAREEEFLLREGRAADAGPVPVAV